MQQAAPPVQQAPSPTASSSQLTLLSVAPPSGSQVANPPAALGSQPTNLVHSRPEAREQMCWVESNMTLESPTFSPDWDADEDMSETQDKGIPIQQTAEDLAEDLFQQSAEDLAEIGKKTSGDGFPNRCSQESTPEAEHKD